MSAPPGYNGGATMLPLTGGTIHAMSGGSMSSPYTGSDSYDTSLLRAVPPSAAPIAEYKGGGGIYARGGAPPGGQSVNNLNAQQPREGYNNNNGSSPEGDGIDQNGGLRAAPASMSNTASSAAVAINAASNAASNAVPAPVPAPAPAPALLVSALSSPENAARAAVATGVVASDLIDSNDLSDPNSLPSPENAARVAVAISAMPHSSSSSTIANETDPFTMAAIAVAASADTNGTVPKSDKKMKTITVYGINYDVTDPAADDNEGWKKLLAKLRLDRLKDKRKIKIKKMIYDEPSCLEKDLPVTSLMTCAPIRFIIENVLIELLHRGKMDDSKSELKVIFDPQKDVEALSKHAVERAVERPSERPSEGPVERPAASAGGTRKARQRRIIRKHT